MEKPVLSMRTLRLEHPVEHFFAAGHLYDYGVLYGVVVLVKGIAAFTGDALNVGAFGPYSVSITACLYSSLAGA